MLQRAHGFRENLGSDLKELPGQDYMNTYIEYVIQMKKNANYKEHISFLEKNFMPTIKEKGIHVKFFPKDTELMIRIYLSIPTSRTPKIPDIIKDAFKDTEQFVKIKAVLGVDAEELLS